MMRISHPILQLQLLKLIKSQVPYSGRKWKQCESKMVWRYSTVAKQPHSKHEDYHGDLPSLSSRTPRRMAGHHGGRRVEGLSYERGDIFEAVGGVL
jgi:Domain of unknown function (DUF3402)